MYNYLDELKEEFYLVDVETCLPVAERYIERVEKRIIRINNGSDIGPMIDSEYESLQIDSDFEKARQKIEIATSYQSQLTPHQSSDDQKPIPFRKRSRKRVSDLRIT